MSTSIRITPSPAGAGEGSIPIPTAPESNSQPDALPRKQGELGYTAPSAGRGTGSDPLSNRTSIRTLDGPHPAERPIDPPPPAMVNPRSSHIPVRATSSDTHTTSSSFMFSVPPSKYSVLMSMRSPRPNPKLGGMSAPTFIRILLTFAIIGATVAGWLFSLHSLNYVKPTPSTPSTDSMSQTSYIFIHIAFGTAIVILLILLERGVFQARAERYALKHPGLAHPRLRGRTAGSQPGFGSSAIALAPWNRPPLPTYAAALGVRGTGDVEDDAIAIPPPPAYGNTRGSTLLLSGVRALRSESRPSSMSEEATRGRNASLDISERRNSRASRIRESIRSFVSGTPRRSTTESRELDTVTVVVEPPPPWLDIESHPCDAYRARLLEEALAKLEAPPPPGLDIASQPCDAYRARVLKEALAKLENGGASTGNPQPRADLPSAQPAAGSSQ